MYSYHTLMLLGGAHQADLLRQAQPQLRPLAPKCQRVGFLGAIAGGAWPGRRARLASTVATDPPPGDMALNRWSFPVALSLRRSK